MIEVSGLVSIMKNTGSLRCSSLCLDFSFFLLFIFLL